MYKLISPVSVQRLADGCCIPLPPAESEGFRYQEWLDLGNTPLPADPVVPAIPQEVTMRQARRALLNAGLLATVNSAIAALPGATGDAARIDWEFSSMVFRNAALVQSLMPVLGLTNAQLDALFVAASEIAP